MALKYMDIRLSIIGPAHTKLYTLIDEAIRLLVRCLTTTKHLRTKGQGLPTMGYSMLKSWFETTCFQSIIIITRQLHYAVLQLWLVHTMLLAFDATMERVSVFGLAPSDPLPRRVPHVPLKIPELVSEPPLTTAATTTLSSSTIQATTTPAPTTTTQPEKLSLQEQINRDIQSAQQKQNAIEIGYFTQLTSAIETSRDYFTGKTNPYSAASMTLLQLGLLSSAALRPSVAFTERKL